MDGEKGADPGLDLMKRYVVGHPHTFLKVLIYTQIGNVHPRF
ncbi:hypothetical protein Lepto7375DRAFT_0401 [Leptolyngbya sp. PCC 7375]|nr:hypothetical protein Lepto7375DRAFT_0401 [Leptolyngbya sp. PCC 7375]